MACLKLSHLQCICTVLKAIVTVLIMKVCLGVFDVGSDFINGYNFISGMFKLGLYFATSTRDAFDQLPDMSAWGYPILIIPWLPGLLRITFLAYDVPWKTLGRSEKLYRISGFVLHFAAWPLFTPLM